MTELDIPRPILTDINRIGDYFNIIRIVAEKIREDCADKGLHTAAAVRAGRGSYQHLENGHGELYLLHTLTR